MQLTFSGQFIRFAPNGAIFIYSYFLAIPFFFSPSLLFVSQMQMAKRHFTKDLLAIDMRSHSFIRKMKIGTNWWQLLILRSDTEQCTDMVLYVVCIWFLVTVAKWSHVTCMPTNRHQHHIQYIVRWWPTFMLFWTLQQSSTLVRRNFNRNKRSRRK